MFGNHQSFWEKRSGWGCKLSKGKVQRYFHLHVSCVASIRWIQFPGWNRGGKVGVDPWPQITWRVWLQDVWRQFILTRMRCICFFLSSLLRCKKNACLVIRSCRSLGWWLFNILFKVRVVLFLLLFIYQGNPPPRSRVRSWCFVLGSKRS